MAKAPKLLLVLVLIIAGIGGSFLYSQLKNKPAPFNASSSSFVRINIPATWEISKYEPKELIPVPLEGEATSTEPIPVYIVREDAPITISGTNSPDIVKMEVRWVPTRSNRFVSPPVDWVFTPLDLFTDGDTTWSFKAELAKNLDYGSSPQQYTVVGVTKKGDKITNNLLLIKAYTENDGAWRRARLDAINKPIIENAKGFAGELERYKVFDYERYESAKSSITKDKTVYILWYSDKNCEENSSTFLERADNCSLNTSSIFGILLDSTNIKNYYLGAYHLGTERIPDLSYNPETKKYVLGIFPIEYHGEEQPVPSPIATIDVSGIIDE
jgi:hypothetical protein